MADHEIPECEAPSDAPVVPDQEVVERVSVKVARALHPLPMHVQLSVACTVLMNLVVATERAIRQDPPRTPEDGEQLGAFRAGTLDAVRRIVQCVEAAQAATTEADLEQAVRLFEDHPATGPRAN